MQKKLIRIMALILCAVMLLGMIPLIAFADEMDFESGYYYVSNFEELKERSSKTYGQYVTLIYVGDEELLITEDLTLPENTVISSWGNTVRIAEGVTVNAYDVMCPLIVDGTLNCMNLTTDTFLDVNGTVNVQDKFVYYRVYTVEGVENIKGAASIIYSFDITSFDELKAVAAEIQAQTDSRVRYSIFAWEHFDITESIDLGMNSYIDFGCSEMTTIVSGAKLTVGALSLYEDLTVCGELEVGEIHLSAPNNSLVIAEGGSVKADIITVQDIYEESGLKEYLSVLDLTQYQINKLADDFWELVYVGADSPEVEVIPGDMDGDGVLNDKDVAQLLWHTLFPEDYPISADADFNGDGKVDDEDVAYLLWHTLFPDEYPIN
ncbi:MAG: hypothetical protein J6A88_07760 [Oscillospiraceae bacterium]|nr:hypothetical protein [Oscillospiraceae bacterium]